jgi:hypothetical protein
MSGSGLIYAAVLGAWAVYFVSRSVRSGPREVIVPTDGVVLRRRGALDVPAGSYSMVRPQAAVPETPVVKQRRPDAAVPAAPIRLRVSAATARRRRRLLLLLTLGCLVMSAMVAGHAAPRWSAVVPLLLLATYLLELRTQARRAGAPRTVGHSADVPPVARRAARRGKHSAEFWDPWPSFDPVETKPGRVADLADGWEPRPVPLPTYITAGRAESAPGRRIDVTAGRPWAEWAEPAEPAAEPADPVVAENPQEPAPAPVDEAGPGGTPIADGLAAEFEHKRAVND